MKNIGILETIGHITYLYSTARILKSQDTQVYIFTTTKNYDLMFSLLGQDMDKYTWIIKNDNESTMAFLKRIKSTIERDIDILYVNTIQGGIREFIAYCRFNPKIKKILTIHNPRFWFEPKNKNSWKEKFKCMLRKTILPRYDGVAGVSEKVAKYIKEQCRYRKSVYAIPFSVHEPYEQLDNKGNVIFAASGAIERIRRNYHKLLDVFEKLFKKYSKIQLKILGKPDGQYGKDIIRRCLELKSKGYNVFVSADYLSGEVFEREIKEVDILIGPIDMSLYDESKETGVIYDAIRFAKPVIIPEDYDIPVEIQSSTLFFKDWDHLGQIIEKLIINKDDKLKELKQVAEKNSLFFTSEYVRKTKDIGL